MKQLSFKHTQLACSLAYISQAVTTSFLPLLFIRLQKQFGFSFAQLTLLITITFLSEIIIDASSPLFINKIGYRKAMAAANLFSAAGIAGLAVLPHIMPNPYSGFIVCVILYSIGGGFDEVLVSPIVEACPTKNKVRAMALLHSSYCWGCVLVILASTLFFKIFGIEKWYIMAVVWAVIPLLNAVYFCFVPIRTIEEEKGRGKFSDMLKKPVFWVMCAAMICAGASELAMSQWASAFAEAGLHISKTAGDLLGPCAFAILMGISRVLYSRFDDKADLSTIMMGCCVICIAAYFMAAFGKNPVVALIGCCLCGLAVAPMWPGTFSLAAKHIPNASTAMFAVFALAGDAGCTVGPTIVGFVSGASENNISRGLLCSAVFPLLMLVCLVLIKRMTKKAQQG